MKQYISLSKLFLKLAIWLYIKIIAKLRYYYNDLVICKENSDYLPVSQSYLIKFYNIKDDRNNFNNDATLLVDPKYVLVSFLMLLAANNQY